MAARPDPGQWTRALASTIDRLGGDGFPAALGEALRLVTPYDSVIVTAYAGMVRPRTLHHDLDELQAVVNTAYYDSGPYLLDPIYVACRNGVEPGPWRLMDLAPPGFFRSEYYDTFYRRIRLVDELALLVPAGEDRHLVISLARGEKGLRFTPADVAAHRSVYPVVAALARRHWGEAAAPAGPEIDRRLKHFGAQLLSPREAEVVQLVLGGRSTRAIANLLGTSEGTVKVHRRHAYAKLGIASQAELFALATRFLHGVD